MIKIEGCRLELINVFLNWEHLISLYPRLVNFQPSQRLEKHCAHLCLRCSVLYYCLVGHTAVGPDLEQRNTEFTCNTKLFGATQDSATNYYSILLL